MPQGNARPAAAASFSADPPPSPDNPGEGRRLWYDKSLFAYWYPHDGSWLIDASLKAAGMIPLFPGPVSGTASRCTVATMWLLANTWPAFVLLMLAYKMGRVLSAPLDSSLPDGQSVYEFSWGVGRTFPLIIVLVSLWLAQQDLVAAKIGRNPLVRKRFRSSLPPTTGEAAEVHLLDHKSLRGHRARYLSRTTAWHLGAALVVSSASWAIKDWRRFSGDSYGHAFLWLDRKLRLDEAMSLDRFGLFLSLVDLLFYAVISLAFVGASLFFHTVRREMKIEVERNVFREPVPGADTAGVLSKEARMALAGYNGYDGPVPELYRLDAGCERRVDYGKIVVKESRAVRVILDATRMGLGGVMARRAAFLDIWGRRKIALIFLAPYLLWGVVSAVVFAFVPEANAKLEDIQVIVVVGLLPASFLFAAQHKFEHERKALYAIGQNTFRNRKDRESEMKPAYEIGPWKEATDLLRLFNEECQNEFKVTSPFRRLRMSGAFDALFPACSWAGDQEPDDDGGGGSGGGPAPRNLSDARAELGPFLGDRVAATMVLVYAHTGFVARTALTKSSLSKPIILESASAFLLALVTAVCSLGYQAFRLWLQFPACIQYSSSSGMSRSDGRARTNCTDFMGTVPDTVRDVELAVSEGPLTVAVLVPLIVFFVAGLSQTTRQIAATVWGAALVVAAVQTGLLIGISDAGDVPPWMWVAPGILWAASFPLAGFYTDRQRLPSWLGRLLCRSRGGRGSGGTPEKNGPISMHLGHENSCWNKALAWCFGDSSADVTAGRSGEALAGSQSSASGVSKVQAQDSPAAAQVQRAHQLRLWMLLALYMVVLTVPFSVFATYVIPRYAASDSSSLSQSLVLAVTATGFLLQLVVSVISKPLKRGEECAEHLNVVRRMRTLKTSRRNVAQQAQPAGGRRMKHHSTLSKWRNDLRDVLPARRMAIKCCFAPCYGVEAAVESLHHCHCCCSGPRGAGDGIGYDGVEADDLAERGAPPADAEGVALDVAPAPVSAASTSPAPGGNGASGPRLCRARGLCGCAECEDERDRADGLETGARAIPDIRMADAKNSLLRGPERRNRRVDYFCGRTGVRVAAGSESSGAAAGGEVAPPSMPADSADEEKATADDAPAAGAGAAGGRAASTTRLDVKWAEVAGALLLLSDREQKGAKCPACERSPAAESSEPPLGTRAPAITRYARSVLLIPTLLIVEVLGRLMLTNLESLADQATVVLLVSAAEIVKRGISPWFVRWGWHFLFCLKDCLCCCGGKSATVADRDDNNEKKPAFKASKKRDRHVHSRYDAQEDSLLHYIELVSIFFAFAFSFFVYERYDVPKQPGRTLQILSLVLQVGATTVTAAVYTKLESSYFHRPVLVQWHAYSRVWVAFTSLSMIALISASSRMHLIAVLFSRVGSESP